MLLRNISIKNISWLYYDDKKINFQNRLKDRTFSGNLVKESPKRTILHGSDLYVKEVRYSGLSSILKTISGGNACKEGRIYLELSKYGIRVPTVIGYGVQRNFFGLIVRDLLVTGEVQDGSRLLDFLCNDYQNIEHNLNVKILNSFACFIRVLHDKGISHGDFHAGNILVKHGVHGAEFILLDVDRVKIYNKSFSVKQRHANLVLLYMGFGSLLSRTQRFRFLKYYCRGLDLDWRQIVRTIDVSALHESAKVWQTKANRCMKNNNHFITERSGFFKIHRVRSVEADGLLHALLPDPDRLLSEGEVFKSGRTVQAVAVNVNGRRYFLKRYNCKGWGFRLKNIFRRSRAVRTWLVTWGFRVRDLPVPKPLICIEARRFRLLESSYLLSEFIEDSRRLSDVWPDMAKRSRTTLLARFGILLGQMHRVGCLHGDLKWNNILLRFVNERPSFVLIDLDASRINCSMRPEKARKDLKRFLRDLETCGSNQDKTFFLKCWKNTAHQRFESSKIKWGSD